ncbi:MAG: DUF3019 domain-containing protein [Pseudomonadales bacterium]|nr:DUF3019 domain-containing protein [Pseudomonadales bacterium]
MFSKSPIKIKTSMVRCLLSFFLATLYWNVSLIPSVYAQESIFSVTPSRCIALHQGQDCYSTIEFQWTLPADEEYCLIQLLGTEPEEFGEITCWSGNEKNSHQLEFVSAANVIYEIRLRNQLNSIGAITVEVAWVYRSGRTNFNRWRLF